ncbi:MAG: hypothetical protein WDZ93_02280 [Candidatus Paceibacterota bacterium]
MATSSAAPPPDPKALKLEEEIRLIDEAIADRERLNKKARGRRARLAEKLSKLR